MADFYTHEGLVLRYHNERIRCREAIDTWYAYGKNILYDLLFFTGHKPPEKADRDAAAMVVGLVREVYNGNQHQHNHQNNLR